MAKVRDIDAEVPRFPVVTGDGIIKMVPFADGVSGAIGAHAGRVFVTPEHEADGWVMLKELYQTEGRMDLWQAWAEHRAAAVAARKVNQTIEPFPTHFLPAEVQRRRIGRRPKAVTWTAPQVAPISIDGEPEKKGPGRPKKEG